MSRRATAKRSAAPSPTPKSAEGNNPSGFILKLFQMVNGAPDDVVSVSKFFVPSFSVCSFRNGYLYWTWEFCERKRQAALHHITIANIHLVVVSQEESGHLRYQHIILVCQHPSRHQIFFVCAGTSPLATFRRAIVLCASAKHTHCPPQLFAYYEICQHSSGGAHIQYLPTCFDQLCRLPWNKFSALSSFVTKMCIWPPA